jgi:hypothetical protein
VDVGEVIQRSWSVYGTCATLLVHDAGREG